MLFIELLNTHWDEWKKSMDFVDVRVLKTKGEMKNLDLSFVEGAIAGEKQIAKLNAIRENSKVVVAIGSCACTGMPAGWRNTFSEEQKKEVQFLVDRFGHLPKIEPIATYIQVDENIPGCPMDEKLFIDLVNKQIASHSELHPE
jgi:coenzyme F420-reducing hydrogenase gamma subunit